MGHKLSGLRHLGLLQMWFLWLRKPCDSQYGLTRIENTLNIGLKALIKVSVQRTKITSMS